MVAVVAIVAGCEGLKYSKPILPITEYERLLVGRLDADYVGTATCLAACHYHDVLRRDFEASTMGAQMSPDSAMPLVDCESCHGPGSLAVEGLTKERVVEDAARGIQTACKYDTLIDLGGMPAQAQSLLCLKCHTSNATFNLHAWNAGAHAEADVSCFSCHDVHSGPDLIVNPRDAVEMCFKCHEAERAEFKLPSRHPMGDSMYCNDCHNPHGTFTEALLREDTPAETCTKCHGQYEGPYLFGHAGLMDECTECHAPHGSPNDRLLNVREPFLCLQCHEGHRTGASATDESRAAFYTRCTDCHSSIHGTDTPSTSGRGVFTR